MESWQTNQNPKKVPNLNFRAPKKIHNAANSHLFDKSFSEMTLGVSGGSDKRFLNLIAIAESQLNDAGVTKLFYSDLCSFSDVRFFSARRLQQQGTREYNGRFATVAFLKG